MAKEAIDLATFDFDSIHREERKVDEPPKREVPANMVKLAQESWDGKKWITFSFRGQSQEFVTNFAETIKFAGDHTTPQTTVLVKHEENSIIVEFRATERRGRKPGATNKSGETSENGTNGTETGQTDSK